MIQFHCSDENLVVIGDGNESAFCHLIFQVSGFYNLNPAKKIRIEQVLGKKLK